VIEPEQRGKAFVLLEKPLEYHAHFTPIVEENERAIAKANHLIAKESTWFLAKPE
jgi:hypothetical protein